MRAVVVIPARYQSSRFPGKPLVDLAGKPMLLWVCRASAQALGPENVYVATDDERIRKTVSDAGYKALMTSDEALTGTDRIAETIDQIDADLIVNVQGDEPLVDPQDIEAVLNEKKRNPGCVVNGFCSLSEFEDPTNVNVPKVVMTESGKMVYMSRAPVPGSKSGLRDVREYSKQVCIYAFTSQELRQFREFGRKGRLEALEDIEILRFLELGIPVQMVRTRGQTLAVDVPEDVGPVEQALRNHHGNQSH